MTGTPRQLPNPLVLRDHHGNAITVQPRRMVTVRWGELELVVNPTTARMLARRLETAAAQIESRRK